MDRHEHLPESLEPLADRSELNLPSVIAKANPRRAPAWLVGLLSLGVASQAVAVWRVHGDLPAGTRPPLRDSVIFEYIGWYLTQGGRLYLDVWELKPPLPYEFTAAVSLLAGGNPVLAHWLNITLTSAAAVATAALAGALVADLTGDGVAAFAAGVALYAFPAYHWRAAFGFKVKYFVPLLVLLGVYLARRERPGLAGIAAGAAAGFWQLAVIAPALALGVARRRGGRSAMRRVIAGTVGTLLVIVLPVVYWGAVEAMVTETFLVPLLVGDQLGAASPLWVATRLLGGSLPVFGLGALGVVLGLARKPRDTWWLALGAGWFAAMAIIVDLDGAPDLFPVLAFLAVGVGMALGLETGSQRPAALLIAVIAVVSVVTLGGFGLGDPMVYQPGPMIYEPGRTVELPYTIIDRAHLFWNQQKPATCRVFYGPTQNQLVQTTGASPFPETCGDPEPVLHGLVSKWFGGSG